MAEKCTSIKVKELQMEKEPFARGGFGKVYMAKWRKVAVVVKVIEATSEEEEEAVQQEADITLRLKHRNVIELFGIASMRNRQLGIVMEKAEHGSLDLLIGKIDRAKLTKIALGIIDGLQYVHSQKVIHRDIKPKNILMFGPKDDMIPKSADFGVSKVIERTTIQTTAGDNFYMAPEVAALNPYGFNADIFSLAMTLFEMFNEQLISQSSIEVKRFAMGVHRGKISKIPDSYKVPAHLRNVIELGWSEHPHERPALTEFYSALQG